MTANAINFVARPADARPLAPPGGAVRLPAGCALQYASIDRLLSREEASAWLTAGERQAAERWRDARRWRAWFAGRIALKRLLLGRLGNGFDLPPTAMEIVSRDRAGRGVQPRAVVAGQMLDWSLSIAHTERSVLVAVAAGGGAIGVDLVDASFAAAEGFARLWFTPAEQAWLAAADSPGAAALWAAKEALYKATNRGEPFRPRQIEIEWPDCRSRFRAATVAAGRCRLTAWQTPEGEIAALATSPPATVHPEDCTDD